jgi:TRAP-type uncharacterized transport system fused permease subunit
LLVAHFFVFMFCCYAPITPPVALAAYTTAGIAGCDPFKAGLQAFRLGFTGFLLPYIIVYGNSLLGLGHWYVILFSFTTAMAGLWMLSIALVGFYQKKTNLFWRVVLGAGAITMILPGVVSDVVGLGILVPFLLTNTSIIKKKLLGESITMKA